jgi:uncharacterized OsmC-like protein
VVASLPRFGFLRGFQPRAPAHTVDAPAERSAKPEGALMTTATLLETGQRFRADPAAGRTSPAVTATLANGHARLSAGPFNWDSDLPQSIGGSNLAPSPTAYLLGALAGCGVAFLADVLAPEFGVTIKGITAVARCHADLAGLLGIEGTTPELTDLALEITVDTEDPGAKTGPMLDAWRGRCPIFLLLQSGCEVRLQLSASAE